MNFALSKLPHFNSVYLLRVPSLTGIAVCIRKAGITIAYKMLFKIYVFLNLLFLEVKCHIGPLQPLQLALIHQSGFASSLNFLKSGIKVLMIRLHLPL